MRTAQSDDLRVEGCDGCISRGFGAALVYRSAFLLSKTAGDLEKGDRRHTLVWTRVLSPKKIPAEFDDGVEDPAWGAAVALCPDETQWNDWLRTHG